MVGAADKKLDFRRSWKEVYTEKQISDALELYDNLGGITAAIRQLGYPYRTIKKEQN